MTTPQLSPKWIANGNFIDRHGLRLLGPFYYYQSNDRGPFLQFAIDADLEIRPEMPEAGHAKAVTLGYAAWSPSFRYHYLKWIESGRSAPVQPPSCFLWNQFWTLEHRLLVGEDMDSRVLSAIGDLLIQHHTDPIPQGLAAAITRLFTFYPYKYGAHYFRDFWAWGHTLPGLAWKIDSLNVHLAHLAACHAPVPRPLAFAICQAASQSALPVDANQFLQTFHQRFPSGFPVAAPAQARKIQFQASHPQTVAALLPRSGEWTFTVPDFFAEPSPLAELLALGGQHPNLSAPDGGFFAEVVVHPGKQSGAVAALPEKTEAARPVVEPAELAALEQETAQIDAMLADLLRRKADDPASSNPGDPRP